MRTETIKTNIGSIELVIINLPPEVTEHHIAPLIPNVENAIREGTSHILLNLSQVVHIQEDGLARLVDILTLVYECGGRVILAAPDSHILQYLHSLKMEQVFEIYSTEQKALQAFKERSF